MALSRDANVTVINLFLCAIIEGRSGPLSRCYRKTEGFIMLEESRRDGEDNNQAARNFHVVSDVRCAR